MKDRFLLIRNMEEYLDMYEAFKTDYKPTGLENLRIENQHCEESRAT